MIVFANRWESDRLNAWSGTPNGILTALCQKLGADNVEVINLGDNKILGFFEKLGKGVLKILSIDSCDMCAVAVDSIDLQTSLKKNKRQPVIVFKEVIGKSAKDSYLFIDCSVDYAYRCHKNAETFEGYVPFAKKRAHTLLAQRNGVAKKYYENCRGIFTMGEWLRRDLVVNGGLPEDKVHAVGGGCNICVDNIDSSLKTGNKFLFVGKDFERKGGPLVVKAFERINSKHEGKYELYIAGPEKWPMNEPIPENVEFLGLKTQNELSKFYNLCDVFVMPSYFEAYGMVFLEALIYGLPCIGRNCCAMNQFITPGENGDLINQDDVDELALKMLKLINNEKLIKNVKENRQNYIEQYSWKTVAERICKVIEDDGYKV